MFFLERKVNENGNRKEKGNVGNKHGDTESGTVSENGLIIANGSSEKGVCIENSDNQGDDNWREVKKKNKENKIKKDLKLSSFEREELDFHFDEEFDQEVPTGRQNTFSNDW